MHERPRAFMDDPGRAMEKQRNREADPGKGHWTERVPFPLPSAFVLYKGIRRRTTKTRA
jgi:hypothetical protein